MNKSKGSGEIFIAKFDNQGNNIWVNSAKGNYVDKANGIAVDTEGSLYITGNYFSPELKFDTITIVNSHQDSSGLDWYIAKYSTDGSIQWVKNLSDNYINIAYPIRTDADNSFYLTGIFSGDSLIYDDSTVIDDGGRYGSTFVFKLNSKGRIRWANSIARSGGSAIDVDAKGNRPNTRGRCGSALLPRWCAVRVHSGFYQAQYG